MKKIIAFLLLAILSLPSIAQQNSTLVYSNAIKKTLNLQKTGTALTVVGGLTLFVGNLMYHRAYNDAGSESVSQKKVSSARTVMFGGMGLMAVGIPLLTVGTVNERHLRIDAELRRAGNNFYAGGFAVRLRF